MKKTYLAIFVAFLSVSTIANGQLNKPQKKFIETFLNERGKKKYPIYFLANNQNRELFDALKSDTLVDKLLLGGRDKPQNKLILTKKEKKEISFHLNKLKQLNWKDEFIPGVKLLSRDTVKYYLKDITYGWQRMDDRGIAGYYSFSNPIFLRNETFCIFQYDYNCGRLCGEGTIMVYRKEKGKWKAYINLANWVS
ncbi:MAG: hypothetical protein EOO85_20415 [Pedobacter sp.]|nr:MAG: hypothetical protein EOO85_20415 [Pedobacter sp.]